MNDLMYTAHENYLSQHLAIRKGNGCEDSKKAMVMLKKHFFIRFGGQHSVTLMTCTPSMK